MATTTPDTLKTPDAGDQYALVQDLGSLADTVQSALIRRANSYAGPAANRTAFATAPEGTSWQDTDGKKGLYVRQGGAWVAQAPSAARLYATSDLTIPTGTERTSTFHTAAYNVGGIASVAQNGIITDRAGIWRVSAGASFGSKGSLMSGGLSVLGAGQGSIAFQGAVFNGYDGDTMTRVNVSSEAYLPAGVLITSNVRGFTNNDSDVRISGASPWSRWLTASFVTSA